MKLSRTIYFAGCLSLLSLTVTEVAHSAPAITSVSGTAVNGDSITINGSGFGTKANAKPLLWWSANDGVTPSSLGRQSTWNRTTPAGQPSTKIVAPGSTKSWAYDFGDPSTYTSVLGVVDFNSPQLYVYRKIYNDFDATKQISIKVDVSGVSGTFQVGQTVKGQSSGATGIISRISPLTSGTRLYFSNSGGSINSSPSTDFKYGERLASPTASGTDDEGNAKYPVGITRSFNYKTIRIGNPQGGLDAIVNIHGEHSGDYYIDVYGNSGLYASEMSKPMSQKPFQWQNNELYYKASDLDTANGVFDYRVDNTQYYTNTFMTRSSSQPAYADALYQGQVSNGAQLNTWVYYDSIYVDDSWNHVMLCQSDTWANCRSPEIQIPTNWTNTKITMKVHLGALHPTSQFYLYVFDSKGNPNPKGYPMCPNCPTSPKLNVK